MSATLRTVGLIGGLSWESTATYYAEINRGVRDALGGLHSARILLHSFDFAEIQALQNEAGWPEAGRRLAEAGRALQGAGAECLLICANLMHRVAPAVEAACSVPLLHIADALGQGAGGRRLEAAASAGDQAGDGRALLPRPPRRAVRRGRHGPGRVSSAATPSRRSTTSPSGTSATSRTPPPSA